MTSPLGAASVRLTLVTRRPRATLAGRALDTVSAMTVNSMLSVVGVAAAVAAVGAVSGVAHGVGAGVVGAAALAAAWPRPDGRSLFEEGRLRLLHRRRRGEYLVLRRVVVDRDAVDAAAFEVVARGQIRRDEARAAEFATAVRRCTGHRDTGDQR